MAKSPKKRSRGRIALTRERVLREAVALADVSGIEALSMRKLGQALGVEAMSLYNHVANKDEILDALVDVVFAEYEVPVETGDWAEAMRAVGESVHAALLRHPWAPMLIESRMTLGPARLRYFESVIGILRRAGFSVRLAYQANMAFDSYVYGFTLQEVSWPFDKEERPEVAEAFAPSVPPEEFPYMTEMMMFVMGGGDEPSASGYAGEFGFGLELILDGLARVLAAEKHET